MAAYINRFISFYRWAETLEDPRVKDWFLMQSPLPTISVVAIYLLFVKFIGPQWMKNRPAANLRWFLPCYNFFLVALNYHIAKELIVGAVAENYSFRCQSINRDPNNVYEMRIADALWWYYFSKIIELMDTVCFVLRKRDRQVTLLHVYHHSTMPLLWWIGVRWVPGGQSLFGATCNSMIHVLMYTYYGLAAFGPKMQKYLWWKRYMTMLQLLQFLIMCAHTVSSLYRGCDFPLWMHWALFFYLLSMITLFGNFYRQEYVNKVQKKTDQKEAKKLK